MMPSEVSMMSFARRSMAAAEMVGAEGSGHQTGRRDGGGANTASSRRKRVRHFTSDDRAAHRVFERSRREAFREQLTELAGLLPSLANTEPGRLSKHAVLQASIARHHEQARATQALLRERDELLAEVNRWRDQSGCGHLVAVATAPVDLLVATEALPDGLPDGLQDGLPDGLLSLENWDVAWDGGLGDLDLLAVPPFQHHSVPDSGAARNGAVGPAAMPMPAATPSTVVPPLEELVEHQSLLVPAVVADGLGQELFW